jgi:hypothetical protein
LFLFPASCIRGIRTCGCAHAFVCVCFVRDVQQLVLELLVKRETLFNDISVYASFARVRTCCALLDWDRSVSASGITTKSSHSNVLPSVCFPPPPSIVQSAPQDESQTTRP